MPDDRPGDTGPDAPRVPAGTSGASRASGGGRARGPKRTPRPEPRARRAAGPAPAANRTGGDGNGATPRGKAKAGRSAARPVASTPAPDAAPTARAAAPVIERPIGDDATAVTALPLPPAPAPAASPVTAPPEAHRSIPALADDDDSRRRRGRRGRRVRRVIRRIELWSVLKLSLVLYTCLYLAVLGALIVVWGLAYSSGQIENLQDFLADVGLENYRFYGDQMFRACAAIGAVGVLAGTIITVFTAALVNLISEITGGIRLIVIEEEPPARR